MPYSYDPNASDLVAEGVQILTITSVDDGFSRKGDQMWTIRLEDPQGHETTEWIVLTPNIVDWKLRPLWEAAGLQWPGGAGILDENQLIDRQVQATITHERSQDFGTQARIQGYAKPGEGDLPGQESFDTNGGGAKQPANATADDEEIPF
jgi:hypothetical protein